MTVELPDGTTVDGTVVEIGRVAEASVGRTGRHVDDVAGHDHARRRRGRVDLDAAPVEVSVVTETRENVLTVPVERAARADRGRVRGRGRRRRAAPAPALSASPACFGGQDPRRHLVRVEPGLFDSGLVEITSDDLEPGDTVVVPS